MGGSVDGAQFAGANPRHYLCGVDAPELRQLWRGEFPANGRSVWNGNHLELHLCNCARGSTKTERAWNSLAGVCRQTVQSLSRALGCREKLASHSTPALRDG
jgi:hypothetical protein